MGHREEVADYLDLEKEWLLAELRQYPLEISTKEDDHAVQVSERFRVVIDHPDQIDILIAQLRAERVTPEEALNPSLVK